jgi:hypothetical protein
MENTIKEIFMKKNVLSLLSALILTGCNSDGSDTTNVVEAISTNQGIATSECYSQCSLVTVSFNDTHTELFDAPYENFGQNNANLNIEVYQDSSTDNYIFSAMLENIQDDSSDLVSVTTQVTFGNDSFPEIYEEYGIVDPAYVYTYTNNNIPYIRGVSFNVYTTDGEVFSGSVLSGEIYKIRVMSPIEYTGDIITDFKFTLLKANVGNTVADINYQLSFTFDHEGTKHHISQNVNIANDGVIGISIPTIPSGT